MQCVEGQKKYALSLVFLRR